MIEGNAIGAIDSERVATFGRSGISVTATEGLILRNNYVDQRRDGCIGIYRSWSALHKAID